MLHHVTTYLWKSSALVNIINFGSVKKNTILNVQGMKSMLNQGPFQKAIFDFCQNYLT